MPCACRRASYIGTGDILGGDGVIVSVWTGPTCWWQPVSSSHDAYSCQK
jgi:hypothetical protein